MSGVERVDPKYLNLLNVRYFVALTSKIKSYRPEVDKLLEAGWQVVFTDNSVEVLENPNVLPRAFFVKNHITVSENIELATILSSPDFDPTTTALVEKPLPKVSLAVGEISEVEYRPNQVDISVKTLADSFLVISDTYDSDWQATLNGQPTLIYQVDGALRGVPLPPGDHQLHLSYLPRSLKSGLLISLGGLIVLLLVPCYRLILLTLSYTKHKIWLIR